MVENICFAIVWVFILYTVHFSIWSSSSLVECKIQDLQFVFYHQRCQPDVESAMSNIKTQIIPKKHGVDKIYKLEKSGVPTTNKQRVYLIPSDLIIAKHVSDQINAEYSQGGQTHTNYVILVPRKLISIMQLFEEEGINGLVTVYAFHMELIQLDSNLLSEEFYDFFRALFINGDQSLLPTVAKSLWTLQMIFGRPQLCVTQGQYSHLVENIMNKLFDSLGKPDRIDSDIGCLMIVDRDIDLASVLLTPGTYTALLDEVFRIKCGTVKINSNDRSYEVHLNNTDSIYTQIKDRHFSDVFTYLSARAKELTLEYKKSQSMSLNEIKQYIAQELKNLTLLKKSLAYHIEACEAIIGEIGQRFERLQKVEHDMLAGTNRKENCTYIEDCTAIGLGGKFSILRLISLLSLTSHGLTSDEIKLLKTEFLHAYGYKYLNVFHNLSKLGLFQEQQGAIAREVPGVNIAHKVMQAVLLPTKRSAFHVVSQKLKLFPEVTSDHDLKNPTDMSYVFGGAYIPLVCQIVSNIIKKDVPLDELAKIIPNFSYTYNNHIKELNKQTFFIYFIGGVTYAEVAACHLLEKLTGCKIFVVGTSVVNGNLLMESVV